MFMRKKPRKRVLPSLLTLLLTFSLLLSAGAPLALAAEPEVADKNILVYALQEARRAADRGETDQVTDEVKAELEKAVTEAESVCADDLATHEQIQTAYANLQAALWKLSYVKQEEPPIYIPTPPKKDDKPEQPDTPEVPVFTDVAEDAWYASSVAYVAAAGLMDGVGDQRFSPDAKLSRAMIMTMLYRLAGKPAQESTEGDSWYAQSLAWAKASGVSDGSNPEGLISREQLFQMLYNYVKPETAAGDLSGFVDADSVSSWARTGMEWAVSLGLVTGKDGSRLDPQGTASRAEAAALFERFLKLTQDEEGSK